MSVAPGWYKDPVEPTTQRYWDGEGWVGPPLPADAPTPGGPPAEEEPEPAPEPVPEPAESKPDPASASGPAPQLRLPPGGTLPPDWVYRSRRAIPQPMPHGLPLASPGARLLARLIDIAAVGGLALLANAWFLFQLGREFGQFYQQVLSDAQQANPEVTGRINTLVFVITLVTAAVWLAYEVPAIANTGQTPGKRALGIKVMRLEQDSKLGFGRALRRWWTLGLPTLLWTCCVGFVLQFVDCLFVAIDQPLHQALHDKNANTVVVHIGRPTSTRTKTRPGGPP